MSGPHLSERLSIPLCFWSRAEVLHALEDHDAGALFRLVRQYCGASQQAIGAAVDLAQPHVSRIMSGRQRMTTLQSWQRVADGLEMPNDARCMIGLADARSAYIGGNSRSGASTAATGDLWSAPRTVEDIAEITLKDLMKRREALVVGGALVVGAALTETFEHWLLPPRGILDRGKGRLGESELRRIEAATVALRHWDDRWRLGIRRKAVVGQLSEVSELAETTQSASVQARLFVVMAELSKIAASMSYDAGDHPTAQKYYMLSLRAIHQAGPEHKLYGVGVLADMARQMLDTKNPRDALDISRIALDSAQAHKAPSTVLAMLRTREGWSYAGMGRAAAYTRSVAQAEELLEEGDADELPSWARNFDRAELLGVVGARYRDLALGQDDKVARTEYARSSADYIAQALRLRDPEKRRNRAFDLVGLGRTYLVLGEPEEAARVVAQAAGIERDLGSGRVRRRLHDWHREAAAFHREPAVAGVREELSNTLLAEPSTSKETA
ncbi:helix-turn-helix domain-containing protein [Nocardiopsis changdeensis]|uniref:Helix-turn-helix domain-containing protein n=1 Tax=Nocardiopsis changdeensis TaxID=2831969 RepID=A0ABX8BUD0_9ACTN|nr:MULTISPECIES: helix-turn-helix transcriptional regulator [Nocardiopsis]QUX23978.1 helix-turn-helix domain-containing protein [Nocardiopsis changdeensis]QYX39923.1 helix-turn-helix domain-containing protein [Nocardiopsis sp. MT53]